MYTLKTINNHVNDCIGEQSRHTDVHTKVSAEICGSYPDNGALVPYSRTITQLI